MLAGKLGTERILADRGVNAVNLVGDQGAAVANPVNENAPLTFALGPQPDWLGRQSLTGRRILHCRSRSQRLHSLLPPVRP